MGTESPDTERMHRLLGEALDDADLTADVVPAVLTGYEHRVKVRRYQGAGVALAVLATAAAAVSVLPRGGAGRGSAAPAAAVQEPDHCKHQMWAAPGVDSDLADHMSPNPAAEQANCEALQSALRSVFPDARLLPDFAPELTFDPRVDRERAREVEQEAHTAPNSSIPDLARYFGAELKSLAVHPDDPANVYLPGRYTLITAAGREEIEVGLENGPPGNGFALLEKQALDSLDCGKMPAAMRGNDQCAQVGRANSWHGTLWTTVEAAFDPRETMSVVSDARGRNLKFTTLGYDKEAWYEDGAYTTGNPIVGPGKMPTWINRWTGETSQSWAPPTSHASTEQQWARFLDSPALTEYADSYLDYVTKVPGAESTGAPTPSRSPGH